MTEQSKIIRITVRLSDGKEYTYELDNLTLADLIQLCEVVQ